MCLFLDIMKIASRLLISTSMALMLTAAAITVILSSTNLVTIANAQQEEQPSSPPAAINNVTSFQSTNDGFRLQVPQGWIIHDVNNTASTLGMEVLEGFGILAQLCPEGEGQQQGAARPNTSNSRCQGAQGEVIHIIRYPNTDTTILPDNNITTYHLQKLEEVGYTNIQTVNSTETTVNLTIPQTNQTAAAMPAKLVEMTYSTASAPDETRRGYFLLTATAATLPDSGTPKGYSILYEAISIPAAETTTTVSSSFPPTPLPPVVEQIFGSFELIAAPEVAQLIAQQQEAEGAETAEGGGNEGATTGGGGETTGGGGATTGGGGEVTEAETGGATTGGGGEPGPEPEPDPEPEPEPEPDPEPEPEPDPEPEPEPDPEPEPEPDPEPEPAAGDD